MPFQIVVVPIFGNFGQSGGQLVGKLLELLIQPGLKLLEALLLRGERLLHLLALFVERLAQLLSPAFGAGCPAGRGFHCCGFRKCRPPHLLPYVA